MEDLVQKVRQLETLYQAVLDSAIEDQDVEQAHVHLKEYQRVRQSIRLRLFSNSVMHLPDVEDKKILTHLQLISSGEDLPSPFLKGLFQDELDIESLQDLSVKHFFSWFSPYDYVEELYEVGSLVVGAGTYPVHLESLVNELRHCFVFKQYHATFALCRTALEISIRDVFEQQGLNDPHSDNYLYVEQRISKSNRRWFMDAPDPSMAQMIGMLCLLRPYRHLKRELRNIVSRSNDIVHGFRTADREDAERMMRSALRAIHDLYEV